MKYQINSKKVELQNTIKDLKDQIQKLKIGTDTNSNNESKKSSSNGIKDPNILKL